MEREEDKEKEREKWKKFSFNQQEATAALIELHRLAALDVMTVCA
jgi:hypothetical protein